jgi:hypothetical protein
MVHLFLLINNTKSLPGSPWLPNLAVPAAQRQVEAAKLLLMVEADQEGE